jgi:CubicO group peptidase (beta-lactamase class C family)
MKPRIYIDFPIKVSYLSYNWEQSTPDKEGLNSTEVLKVIEKAKKLDFIRALGVTKNGKLVVEEYFNGFSSDFAFPMRSGTKSIVSALTGIAIDKQMISSVDQQVIDYFPELKDDIKDNNRKEITIKEILAMRAGFEGADKIYDRSNDWVKYIITKAPIVSLPDEKWAYNGSAPHILSSIISKTSKTKTENFADLYLCKPIGIKIAKWEQDPMGINTGGRGIYITLRDAARFGQLYLENGIINGNQIISSDWIKKSTTAYSNVDDFLSKNIQYGYLRWIDTIDNRFTYRADGFGGQYIVNIPDCKMTIVIFADTDIPDRKVIENMQKLYSLVNELVKSSRIN